MSAIMFKMRNPTGTLRELVRSVIDKAAVTGVENLLLFDDCSLNAAVVAHLGYEAIQHGTPGSLIVIKFEELPDGAQPNFPTELTSAFKVAKTVDIPAPADWKSQQQLWINTYSRIHGDINHALVLSTRDLTDRFIGDCAADALAYSPLGCLLKSEIEKVAKAIIDWNNTELLKEEADPRNTCTDNRMAAQENPQNTDFALCTVLSAKESQCELLLGAYKEHPISEAFRKTRFVREALPYDYNKFREKIVELGCQDTTVDI